jgi:hypothetical protein
VIVLFVGVDLYVDQPFLTFFNSLIVGGGGAVGLYVSIYGRVIQPFLSRGTFETLSSIWRNLDNQNRTNLTILREPSKELAEPPGYAEPPGSAEPKLKNSDIRYTYVVKA